MENTFTLYKVAFEMLKRDYEFEKTHSNLFPKAQS
jgi:hypothetical protein